MTTVTNGVSRKIIDRKLLLSITGRQRWIETLECGHKNTVYGNDAPKAKRRYCFHLDCVQGSMACARNGGER